MNLNNNNSHSSRPSESVYYLEIHDENNSSEACGSGFPKGVHDAYGMTEMKEGSRVIDSEQMMEMKEGSRVIDSEQMMEMKEGSRVIDSEQTAAASLVWQERQCINGGIKSEGERKKDTNRDK